MNTDGMDIHLIKIPLLVFIGSLLIAAGLSWGVTLTLDANRQSLAEINQSVGNDKAILQKRREGNELYRALQQEYLGLFGSGSNPADKLRWMEQLQTQAALLSLPELAYNIKARRPDSSLNSSLTEGFSVYATPIELKAGLLHEDQLLQLADNLGRGGLGAFSFEYCALTLNEGKPVFQPATSNIHAECLIKWFEIVRTETMNADFVAVNIAVITCLHRLHITDHSLGFTVFDQFLPF